MNANKRLNIGITVNLDNYENIRLEADGEVETEEDAMELVAFLDGVLGRMGRGDEKTAGRIDSYRRRVLTPAIGGKATTPAPERTPAPAPAGVREAEPHPAPEATPPETVAPGPEAAPTRAGEEAMAAPPVTPASPPPRAAAPPAPEPETAPPAPAPEKTPPAPEPGQKPAGKPPAPAKVPAAEPGPKTAPEKTPPAGEPETAAASATGEVCEECGGPVTAAQKKVSQMFLGRTLCKKCMPTM
ncbi:MAG: hypothetical protein ACP5C4_02830 [Methanomicrobiales archaeon]